MSVRMLLSPNLFMIPDMICTIAFLISTKREEDVAIFPMDIAILTAEM